jgi:hypothetical protein
MAINVNISPRIIPNIASVYTDPNRIFMEYIDNSLDSAEKYYDKETNFYSKEIIIKLSIVGDKDKNGIVEIEDNCTGIDDISKLVESIGNSEKKSQTFTNGQFGYGVYSFMATCNRFEVTTKYENSDKTFYLPINRNQFEVDSVDDVDIPDPIEVKKLFDSGTLVGLSDFDKGSWKEINHNELKKEIMEHFELLLSRGNLVIKIIDNSGNEYYCTPFNYEEFSGTTISEEVHELTRVTSRKGNLKYIHPLELPIRTFIKITEDKVINKPPLFFVKGRAIGKVGDIFKRTKHKSDIWSHPNITGYIDLAYNIEPTIARTDLKNTDITKALFCYLEEVLEPYLLNELNEIKRENETRHYKSLENELNRTLSKLAKLDALNFRTEVITGKEKKLETGSEGTGFEIGMGAKDRGDEKDSQTKNPFKIGENEGEGFGPGDVSGELPGEEGEGDAPIKDSENPFADKTAGERKRSGFNIKILDQDPPKDLDSNLIRSQEIDGTIIIYRRHPDFLERIDSTSRRGEDRVSQRLITYLAGEITVHYKDVLQTRDGQQPEYNKALFENLVEFIYQFESMLVDLKGNNLADFNK